jgi:hypothetical protein
VILLVYKEQLVCYPEAVHVSTEKNYINIFEAFKTGSAHHTTQIFFLNFLKSFFQQEKNNSTHWKLKKLSGLVG